jgi:MYXO-CTERM domain-containing protein
MEASVKRILQKALPIVALAALAAFTPTRVEAGPIALAPGTPNQSLLLTGAQDNGLASPGTLLASIASPFSIVSPGNGIILGSVTAAVYKNALGFIDFYYQIVNTTVSTNTHLAISGLTGYNFGGYSTSVGYYSNASVFGGLFATPTGGLHAVNPKTADRSTDGNKVTLWFGPPFGSKVFPQTTSAVLQIATNATSFGSGSATVQNTGYATVNAFSVPEPTSAVVALLGFALLGMRRRRA